MTEYRQPEAPFSIYLIDFERVDDVEHLEKKPEEEGFFDSMIDIIERKIENTLRTRRGAIYNVITQGNYRGIVFSMTYNPTWQDLILQMLATNKNENSNGNVSLLNVNASYILLYHDEENIYCMTGGYGSHYIRCFVDSNFGLGLLPKVLSEDDPALRGILQNHLSGSLISSSTEHRDLVNFRAERDMSSVFRELSVVINQTLAAEFGIPFEEGRNTPVNLESKDSLVIEKSLSLPELTNVLKQLTVLRKREDKFALNYLVEVKKVGLRNADMLDILCEQLSTGDIGDFVIVGDNYADYLSKSSVYIVYDSLGNEFFPTGAPMGVPLELSHVITQITTEGRTLSASFMHEFIKRWKICSKNVNGIDVLHATPFFNAIQGHITTGDGIPVFLYNGKWHVIDKKYEKVLGKEFLHVCELYQKSADDIARRFNILHTIDGASLSESIYNDSLKTGHPHVIFTHTVKMQNIEIADAILYDENTVYFLHNKGKFDGEGCRDVLNQILSSAYYSVRCEVTMIEIIGQRNIMERLIFQNWAAIMKARLPMMSLLKCFLTQEMSYILLGMLVVIR